MIYFQLLLCAFVLNETASSDTTVEPKVMDFTKPDAANKWYAVNDGVMGGRSEGGFRITDEKLEFFGTLSLANNGGFASIRSRNTAWNLKAGDSIVMKVCGDGRKYSVNLYPSSQRTAFSYRAEFQTKVNEWVEVRVPLSKLVATSFGRIVPNARLIPEQVGSVGITLGDKKPGKFKLQVESISVARSTLE